MDSLSLEQLKRVTWNKNYAEVILSKLERSLSEMRYFINIPLAKRNENYAEFYSYVEIIKIVGNKPSKILDAACGRGEVAQMLALKGHKVSACDILDYSTLDKSLVDFKLADLNKPLPYDDNYFDAVINNVSLQLLSYPSKFIAEITRVLKNNGNFILGIPNFHSLQGRYAFLMSGELTFYNVRDPNTKVFTNISIIYLPVLLEMLHTYGFEIVDIRANALSHSRRLRIFDALFGNLICDIEEKRNNVVRYSHTLIITAKLRK